MTTVHRDEDDHDDDIHRDLDSDGDGNSPLNTSTHLQQQQPSSETPLPLHQTNVPRVCCAILASITTGGTTYAFGLYGDALKKSLHLTQSQLDTISAVFFSAGLLSFIPGGFADKYGTRLGISIGGVTGALALLSFWVVAKGWIPFLSNDPEIVVMVLSTLSVGIFLSCALVTGSVFKIISCQCGPGSKGSAVGVAKGFVGLGSGAYACIFESIRQPYMTELDFLPMCAFFFIVAASIPSWFILPSKEHETLVPDVLTPLHFRLMYASLMVLAMLIIGNALGQLHGDKTAKSNDAAHSNYFMALLILTAWWGPIVAQAFLPQKNDPRSPMALRTEQDSNDEEDEEETLLNYDGDDGNTNDRINHSQSEMSTGIAMEPILPSRLEAMSDDEFVDEEEAEYDTPQQQQRHDSTFEPVNDKNLMQMLSTSSAWMMLWSATILAGGGTVETNNLGQMVESLGFSKVVVPATLALFSVAQSGGRVITGAISESALNYNTRRCCIDKGIPRPFFFVVASFAAVLSHAMLATATEEVYFVFGVTLSGIAFGMIWPLLVLCVGEIYGTAHVGANYMFYDGVTSAGGTFLLSKVVAQEVYEGHIDPNGSSSTTCYGQACFRETHVVIVILSLTCIVTSAMLQYKTRNVYNKTGSQR
ncbi:major facilitator superfamily transporter [Nitzschia inconspicua]|uniref:Major facilitator superfamily transporter n=1 Tax=Nitzschia inconspicua TaxID=303405 RepID=A0A9K3PUJ9_9STRA|nr:major facilitator superfamily transporter [Nitzschia inconspicua]